MHRKIIHGIEQLRNDGVRCGSCSKLKSGRRIDSRSRDYCVDVSIDIVLRNRTGAGPGDSNRGHVIGVYP